MEIVLRATTEPRRRALESADDIVDRHCLGTDDGRQCDVGLERKSGLWNGYYSFRTESPARIVPARITLAFTPRSRRCLPTGVLMNFKASSP